MPLISDPTFMCKNLDYIWQIKIRVLNMFWLCSAVCGYTSSIWNTNQSVDYDITTSDFSGPTTINGDAAELALGQNSVK